MIDGSKQVVLDQTGFSIQGAMNHSVKKKGDTSNRTSMIHVSRFALKVGKTLHSDNCLAMV